MTFFQRSLVRLFLVACLPLACTGGMLMAQDSAAFERRMKYFVAAQRSQDQQQDSLARLSYEVSTCDDAGRIVMDSLTGLAYHRIATMYFNAAKDTLAMPYFRRSLALRDSLFAGPHDEKAHVRTNMGMSMYYYGDIDSAALLIQEANAIYEQLPAPDSLNWIKSLNQLGALALQYDDYSMGYASSYRAVEICQALDKVDDLTSFLTYYQAVRVLFNFGDAEQSLVYAMRALAFLPAEDNAQNFAFCHNLIGLIYRELGDDSASLLHLRLALSNLEDDGKILRPLADSHLYLAEHFAKAGLTGQRDRHGALARKYYARLNQMNSFYARTQLPRFAIAHGDYATARMMLDETVANLCPVAIEDTPTDCAVQRVNALLMRARVHAETGQSDRAMADYAVAFDLQDRLRQKATDPTSRRYLSSDLRPDMDRAVQVFYERFVSTGDREYLWEAFRLSERARAFSLMANLHNRVSDQAVRDLQRSIATLERRVARGNMEDKSELEARRIRLGRLLNDRPKDRNNDLLLDSDRLAGYLSKRNMHLLEYHLSDSLNLAFLLSPRGELKVFRLREGADLNDRVPSWIAAITESGFRRKSLRPAASQCELDSAFLVEGLALAHYVLPAGLREALPADSPVCIVPDGSLSYLPFAALPMDDDASLPLNYRTLAYFQDKVEVSFAYSGAYLARVGEEGGRAYSTNLLAFAPAFHTSLADETGRGVASDQQQHGGLNPLVFNQEEARGIAELLPLSEVFCGVAASREQFLNKVGSCRILHLSTHGAVDPLQPQLSFVAFSQSTAAMDEKELLYFNDLLSLPINNELTVLSACETSLGKLAAGETPLSFASAFAAAGARSTLTTLWRVDDRATKELMIEFYRQLYAGKDRVTALCAAQSALRSSDYFHPYYWSAPTLYGATGEIALKELATAGFGMTWPCLALVCLAIAGMLTYHHFRI